MTSTAATTGTNSTEPVYGPGYGPNSAVLAEHRAALAADRAALEAAGRFEPGRLVRFGESMMTRLLRQQRGNHGARLQLLRQNEIGMEVQGQPSRGRVNVRYRIHSSEDWSYRTFAARDLVRVTA